jgi:hypothetical protein
MALRFEAWTLPWSSTFERVIADLPALPGSSGLVRLSDFGEGSITLPEDYDRLGDIISDTVGTLIRVYDGQTIVQEFLAERVDRNNQDTGTVTVSGPDLSDVFNRTVVYPFDYPDNPSAFPDHVWGGVNVLSNPGFEDGLGTNDVYEVWHDHTGGTFTLTVAAQTTVALAHNINPITMELRIQDLSTVNDVTVVGEGTEANPWVITFFSPTSVTMTGNGSSLTGGTAFNVTETQSAESDAGAWTVSQGADQVIEPRVHGSATIAVQTAVVDEGTFALQINAASQLGGAQQVVRVEPGGTYQASIRIRSTATGPFRFVIRDIYENFIAANPSQGGGFSVAANTWTTVTIPDVTIPAGVEAVIFRIAYVGTGTQTFYVDSAEFKEGMAATTAGEIVAMLMDDAAVDHVSNTRGAVLDWIDYTSFGASTDSSSASWVDDLSITAFAGMSYGQFFDSLVQLGYEWRLAPKAAPGATTHDLELYISGNMGTDHTTAASPAINFGQGTLGGPVVQRIPSYTRVLAIGADGAFTESSDSTALTNFGPFESSRQDVAWNSTDTLNAAAAEMLDSESRNRVAVQVSVIATDDHARPLVDYTVGDTIYFQIPPGLPKTARRVRSIAWRHGEPATYQVTGSRIFTAESGAWEAVRRLLREFKRPAPKGSSGALSIGGGKIPWLVAASDSSAAYKAAAKYVCDGSNDHVTWQQAIDEIDESGSLGGELWVAPGTYEFSYPGDGSACIRGSKGTSTALRIVGLGGRFSQTVNVSGSASANQRVFYQVDGGAENLYVSDNNMGDESRIFEITSPTAVFRNVAIDIGFGWGIYNLSASIVVEGCYFIATSGTHCVYSRIGAPLDPVRIVGNYMRSTQYGVFLDCILTGTAVVNPRVIVADNTIDAINAFHIQSSTRPLTGVQVTGNTFVDFTNR